MCTTRELRIQDTLSSLLHLLQITFFFVCFLNQKQAKKARKINKKKGAKNQNERGAQNQNKEVGKNNTKIEVIQRTLFHTFSHRENM